MLTIYSSFDTRKDVAPVVAAIDTLLFDTANCIIAPASVLVVLM